MNPTSKAKISLLKLYLGKHFLTLTPEEQQLAWVLAGDREVGEEIVRYMNLRTLEREEDTGPFARLDIYERETLYRLLHPVVGMGATKHMYSDRLAFTIVRVSPSSRMFWMTRDKVTRTDKLGMTDSGQVYSYESQKGDGMQVSRRRDGRWKTEDGTIVGVGYRNEYYDFSY